jgi:uncharacterized membrane protein
VEETLGESQSGPAASYGETINLYESYEVSIISEGFSSDYRLYVEQDGTYRFMNGGYQDGSEVFIFDEGLELVAHITGSTYEVTLDDSVIYYVVAQFQDKEKIGSYHLSVWPV